MKKELHRMFFNTMLCDSAVFGILHNGSGLNEGAIKSTSLSPTTNDCKMNKTNINHYTALSFKPMLPECVGIVRGAVGFNKNCEGWIF